MSWKIGDIRTVLKNSALAMLKGEFLLRLNAGKYFVHIVYAFVLFVLAIWLSLSIEDSMAEVEKNKAVISELQITNRQLQFEISHARQRSTVEQRLLEAGSDVREPLKPATRIGK